MTVKLYILFVGCLTCSFSLLAGASVVCPPGYYGADCSKECNGCFECDQTTGECVDEPIIHFCPPGFYGPACSRTCDCNGGECDLKTGKCKTDKPVTDKPKPATPEPEIPSTTQAPPEFESHYVGCYKDSIPRAMPHLAHIEPSRLTTKACVVACINMGFTFAGLQEGKHCFCGEERYNCYGPSDRCDRMCNAASNEKCGGFFTNSVYSVCPVGYFGEGCKQECHCSLDKPQCNYKTGKCSSECEQGWMGVTCSVKDLEEERNVTDLYIGCYADEEVRAMSYFVQQCNSMTIGKCVQACRILRYTFAGLQNGNQCFCGNSARRYGVSEKCTQPCGGNHQEICGGGWANSVYTVCKPGIYGLDCDHKCGHCSKSMPSCHGVTGTCLFGCEDGWTGPKCDQKEPDPTKEDCHSDEMKEAKDEKNKGP